MADKSFFTELTGAIERFQRSDRGVQISDLTADSQLELPGAEDWPRLERQSADDDFRRALARFIIAAMPHDRRAAAAAADALFIPREIDGDNIVAFPSSSKRFGAAALSRSISSLTPAPSGTAVSDKLGSIGIVDLGSLMTPEGQSRCKLLQLTQTEFEALDELFARFGLRLSPGLRPHPGAAPAQSLQA